MDDDSKIAKFYDTVANKLKYFDPMVASAEQEAKRIWVPKLPIIPAKVALKVVTSLTTPWELHQHLCTYEEDRDPKVKDMLNEHSITLP